jgi:hypothetical protein
VPSIKDVLIEYAREAATGDNQFYMSLPYAFKLVTAPGYGPTGPTGEALFPLPMAPQTLDYQLDFAVELTGQDGGVIAEEAGVVIGDLRIAATTGFSLKQCRDTSVKAGGGKWTGDLPKEVSFNQPLSGQMLLWRMMGRCFDAYSELKKDPDVAHLTYLEFHGLKDKLHLEIVPRRVKVIRNPTLYRVTYGYEVEASVVGVARQPLAQYELDAMGDDKSILDYMKDSIALMRSAVNMIEATIDDFNAAMSDLQGKFQSVVGIVSDLTRVVDSARDFIDGRVAFVSVTEAYLTGVVSDADTVIDEIEAAVSSGYSTLSTEAMAGLVDVMMSCNDAMEQMIVATKGHHREDWEAQVVSHKTATAFRGNLSSSQLEAIQNAAETASGAPGAQTASSVFSAPYKPGDAKRILNKDQSPLIKSGKYTGYREVIVSRADTIESLAMKHMGDPTRWVDIAIVNDLKAPYISKSARIPYTKCVGDPILIPIMASSSGVPNQYTGSGKPGASQIESALGVDIRLKKLPSGQYGWYCDVAGGSVDVQLIRGTNNLVQGLGTRLRTEQRTNPQFPGMGLPRLVGENPEAEGKGSLYFAARWSLEQQLEKDPRIERIISVKVSTEIDVVTVEIDAQPIGYDASRVFPVQVT